MTGPEPASGILESSVLGPIGIQLNSQLVKSWINLRPCGLSPNNLKSEIWNRPPELIWPAGSQSCNPHFCSDPDFDIIVTISNSGQKCSQDSATMAVWCHHGCLMPPWLFHIMAVWCHHGDPQKMFLVFSCSQCSTARSSDYSVMSTQKGPELHFVFNWCITGIVIQCHCHGTFTNKSKRSWIVSCFLTVCF